VKKKSKRERRKKKERREKKKEEKYVSKSFSIVNFFFENYTLKII